MEKNKKKWMILSFIFILVIIGSIVGTYAYFAVSFTDERNFSDNTGKTNISATPEAAETFIKNIPDNAGSFLDALVYPGHKEVVALSVSIRGDVGSSSSFEFKYHVEENGFQDHIKVTLYKRKTPLETTENYFECVKKQEGQGGETRYFETCNDNVVGSVMQETILKGGMEEVSLGKDTLVIKNSEEEVTGYYYAVVEFVDILDSQNEDMNKVLKGKIDVELIPYFDAEYYFEEDTVAPIAVMSVTREGKNFIVDASNSSDEGSGIKKYYFSTNNKDWVSSLKASYTFSDDAITKYGTGTNLVKIIEATRTIDTIYLKVEDEAGNVSSVKEKFVGELAYDETADNNLRYISSNPYNYVYFNCTDPSNPTQDSCELWRIIGVMNNIDDGDGNKETRIKLIREEPIGLYSWDTSYYGGYQSNSINGGFGVNEWSMSDIKVLLNEGPYWNHTTGNCYYDWNNRTVPCDFTATGLKDSGKEMISNAIWATGANGGTNPSNIIPSLFYSLERGSAVGKTCPYGDWCTDTVKRATTWTGMVGLLYPSDFGFATSGGDTLKRSVCLNTYLKSWQGGNIECSNNNWLFSGALEWTMMPTTYAEHADVVFSLAAAGGVGATNAMNDNRIRPTVYLKDSIQIISGTGEATNPYVLKAIL